MDPTDERENLASIRNAKANSDFVIVAVHSHEPGNFSDTPSDVLPKPAQEAIDNGADAFVGHGPHILIPLPDRKTLLVGIVDDDSASSIDIATKRVTLTVGARRPPSRRSAPWMTLADRKTIGQ